jgi:hypothetical protein
VGDYRGDVKKLFDVGDVISPWSNGSTHKWNETSGQFIPTTVGIQVLSFNTSTSTYTLDVRTSSPEQLAPSRPQNLHVAPYNGNPKLTWTKNEELDVTGGAAYRVYRNGLLIGTAAQSSNPYYIDETVSWNGQTNGIRTATYVVRAIDTQGLLSISSDPVSVRFNLYIDKHPRDISQAVPIQFVLDQNPPNPFNPATTIDYQLPADGFVSLKVYDVLGRIVAGLVDGYQSAGYYAGTWNAQAVGSGLYLYRLTVKTDDGKSFSATKKMLLTK